jgi:hypothetical protein
MVEAGDQSAEDRDGCCHDGVYDLVDAQHPAAERPVACGYEAGEHHLRRPRPRGEQRGKLRALGLWSFPLDRGLPGGLEKRRWVALGRLPLGPFHRPERYTPGRGQ